MREGEGFAPWGGEMWHCNRERACTPKSRIITTTTHHTSEKPTMYFCHTMPVLQAFHSHSNSTFTWLCFRLLAGTKDIYFPHFCPSRSQHHLTQRLAPHCSLVEKEIEVCSHHKCKLEVTDWLTYLLLSENFSGVSKSSMGISSGAAFSNFLIFFFTRSFCACSLFGSTFFFFFGCALAR